jgi:hypothetical protein
MSQEDYLGPQRGRTGLGTLPYAYPKSTKEFRTLPLTPQFKDESPAGNQHLRYENNGSSAQRIKLQMWDLVPIEGGGGTYKCHAPRIISPIRTTVSATELTITGNSFTPAADNWVFVKMDFTGLAEIEMASTWDSHPDWYEFDGDELLYARIPLWRLVDVSEEGAVSIAEDLWAIRYVGVGPLRSVRQTGVVTGDTKLATVIDLV